MARALVGTEGTCVRCSEATVRLVEAPAVRALAVLGYADGYTAADARRCRSARYGPLTDRGDGRRPDRRAAGSQPRSRVAELPRGGGWLFVETGGATRAEAEAARAAVRGGRRRGRRRRSSATRPEQRALWRIREDGAGIVTRSPDGERGLARAGRTAAVPPERLGAYLREFDALLAEHGRRGASYGHFGDGCIHVRIDFDLLSAPGVADFRAFMEEWRTWRSAHGGSLSGEHGDGEARAELLPRMYPPEIVDAFAGFKGIWDPDGRMNPGRVVRPAKLDEDLRVFVGSAHARGTAGVRVHRGPRLLRPGHPPLSGRRAVRTRRPAA